MVGFRSDLDAGCAHRTQGLEEKGGVFGGRGPASFKLSGTPRVYERSLPFPLVHLDLDLAVDLQARSIGGKAVLHFRRHAKSETVLKLDAVAFELQSVECDLGQGFSRAAYTYDGTTLAVKVGAKCKSGRLRIRYLAKPERGLYFLRPDAAVPDRPLQAWSQCQDEDARHWFPCHDKPHAKMTLAMNVRVPRGFTALSNGDPVSVARKPSDRASQFRFRMNEPLPSYLVTLVVGKFEIVEDRPARLADGRTIPVRYYVPKGQSASAKRALGETPNMIELMSRLTGVPYPWSRYSQVVVSDFIFGGMENTTSSTLYEHVLLDEKAAVDNTSNDLVAHELAHQWFGDLVTCRDWSHAWLNEGFATFFEHLERESRLGIDEYEHGVTGDLDSYLNEAEGRYLRPVVCRDYMEPIDLFDRHLYEKGSLVLHMLRRQLGEATFWHGVQDYLRERAHSVVETTDLVRALERASGLSLERFFDQWVYRPGHPVLKVRVGYEDGLLAVTAKQEQKTEETSVFSFPFEIEIRHRGGKVTRHEKEAREVTETLIIRLPERPEHVAFDPDFKVTAKTSYEIPRDMLRNQLAHGTRARLRRLAAAALGQKKDFVSARALGAALQKKSETWMVRAEAASALAALESEEAENDLVSALSTDHPKVRRAVVAALGKIKKPALIEPLTQILRKDASYLVEAEAARALASCCRPRETHAPKVSKLLTQELGKRSWADVRMSGVIEGLAALREHAPLETLLAQTRYGVPTRARRAAIRALPQVSDSDRVRRELEDLLDDGDPHLRIDVVVALRNLRTGRSRGALQRRLGRETDGRVIRRIREALREGSNDLSEEQRRQADQLQELTKELGELKAKLFRLETQRGRGASKKPRVRAKK